MKDTYPEGCLWVGHLKPDTDAVCSAFAAAELFKGSYALAEPPNSEAQFVINNLSLPSFPFFESVSPNYECIGVVDHNQQNQSPIRQNRDFDHLKAIIDHHAIQTNIFDLDQIVHVNIRPWGCTSSILYHIYKISNSTPSKQAAGCMLSAILSDTLFLHSPTTTNFDRIYVEELSQIAEITNVSDYFFQMGVAKSDISGLSPKEVLLQDSKEFKIQWQNDVECLVFWATYETFSPSTVLGSADIYLEVMRQFKEEKGYDLVFFSVVDIYQAQEANTHISSLLLPSEVEKEIAVSTYGKPMISDSIMDLSPYVSRKKQFLPQLDEFLGHTDSTTYFPTPPTTSQAATTTTTPPPTTTTRRPLHRRRK